MPKAVKAKKALGQHFLTDLDIARRIAGTISPEGVDDETLGQLPVLEIGPGMGVLSQFLMSTGRKVKAVEIDKESVGFLAATYPSRRHGSRLPQT